MIKRRISSAFTIVELLVVIIVIGVLAAITVVSYTGLTSRAVSASLKTDLTNASRKLQLYYVDHDSVYPASMTDNGNGNYCPTPEDTKYCTKASSGNTLSYSSSSPYSSFSLFANNTNGTTYLVTDTSSPVEFSLPPNTIDNGDGTYTTTIYADSSDGSVGLALEGGAPIECPQVLANQALVDVDSSTDCSGDYDYFHISFNYFVKFPISIIPGNIVSANFFVYKTNVFTYYSDPRKLASIPDFGTLDVSDYNLVPYNSNLGTIFTSGSAAGYYNLSVTSAVINDKNNSRSYSSFKIYPTTTPYIQNRLNSSTASTNKPYLSVTWEL